MKRRDGRVHRQHVLELASQGHTPAVIAARTGLAPRTVRGHLADPAVAVQLQQLQDDRLRRLSRQALVAGEAAVQVLQEVAADDTALPSARVAACRTILDNLTRLLEVSNLADRLTALEAATAEQGRETRR